MNRLNPPPWVLTAVQRALWLWQLRARSAWRQAQRQQLPLLVALGMAGLLLWAALYAGTRTQVQLRHAQAADALAAALNHAPGGLSQRLDMLPLLAQAGGQSLQLSDHSGQVLARQSASGVRFMPAWLPSLFADVSHQPRALVVDGQALLLVARAPIHDLTRLFWLASAALLAAALVTSLALWLLGRRRQRHMHRAVLAALAQARSLGEAGYVTPRGLGLSELRPVTLAMDQLHQRMRALFEVHAEQLEALRRQAHTDALTGLPNRRHFVAVVEALLGGEGAPPDAGLVLLRLADLQGLNQRLGHAGTDQVLQSVAEVMASYPQRTERCAVGRLSGGDFGLLLPAGGVARETAQTLLQALRAQLQRIDPAARLQVGAVELRPPMAAGQALVMAQAALATANAPPPPADHPLPSTAPAPLSVPGARRAFASGDPPRQSSDVDDEAAWQRRLARALVQGRVKLGEFAVVNAQGRQLLWDCPLRVQLAPGGPYEPAARWLAQASRSKLNSVVDEKAVMLALAAIAQDGEARCVNIAAASANSAEFVASLSRRLAAAPEAAAQLRLDLPESLALEQPDLVRTLTSRWRPMGTLVALEHCGEGLLRVPRLINLGLDCVRIDGRFVNGIAEPQAEAARNYLRGLVRLVQSVGLSVTAESVRSADDLAVLWQLGFDAATGPAVLHRRSSATEVERLSV